MSVLPMRRITEMAADFAPAGYIQQSAIAGREAPAGASVSADNAASVAAVAALQVEAQQRINSDQHQQIGSVP
jgi:hypothetical protein